VNGARLYEVRFSEDGYEVRFSREARETIAALTGQRRARLREGIRDLALEAPNRRHSRRVGVGVLAKRDVASCELSHEERVVYVHAVLTREQALEALVGEGIYARWRARLSSRLNHGRWY
jgi:hypothetical protein